MSLTSVQMLGRMRRAGEKVSSTVGSSTVAGFILADVPHELRLQTLCAHFSADVQCAFFPRDFLVPRTKVEHRVIELGE
jgi:hypothetical protein